MPARVEEPQALVTELLVPGKTKGFEGAASRKESAASRHLCCRASKSAFDHKVSECTR